MKKLISLLLSVLLVMSLCACGASAGDQESPAEAPAPMAVYSDSAASGSMNGFAMTEAAAAADYAYAEEELYEAKAAEAGGSSTVPEVDPEKIIYSAEATVETTEFDETIAALTKLVEECGGWIESSSMEGANYYSAASGNVSNRYAWYTLRIPADRFQGMMGSLSTLGNVPYTRNWSENVTAQYYDVQARLTAYEAQETRLLEMMEIAESVEDIITIEEKLADVRYNIDSLQSSLNNWDRRVSYSTLNLSIQEVQLYTPQAVSRLSYGERLWNAFTGALKNAGNFFSDLLIFLVSAIPTLVILAVLFFVLRPVFRKQLPKLREKHDALKAKREAVKEAKRAAKATKL